jgi:hypothetical protein
MNDQLFSPNGIVPIINCFPKFKEASIFAEIICPNFKESLEYINLKKSHTKINKNKEHDGSKIEQHYLDDQIIYRKRANGVTVEEYWYENKNLNKDDGPSYTKSKYNKLVKEDWYNHGKLHRIDGPACIEYNSKNKKIRQEWYINGILHRDDGPAVIRNHANETTNEWWNNGKICKSQNQCSMERIKTSRKKIDVYITHISI